MLVDRDHSGSDALEDGVDHLAALVNLGVGAGEVAVAALQLPGLGLQRLTHAVERLDQGAQLIDSCCLDAVVKVSAGQFARGVEQGLDRARDLPGRELRQPDRDEQREDRDQRQHVHVGAPSHWPCRFEMLPLGYLGLHKGLVLQDRRRDLAPHHQPRRACCCRTDGHGGVEPALGDAGLLGGGMVFQQPRHNRRGLVARSDCSLCDFLAVATDAYVVCAGILEQGLQCPFLAGQAARNGLGGALRTSLQIREHFCRGGLHEALRALKDPDGGLGEPLVEVSVQQLERVDDMGRDRQDAQSEHADHKLGLQLRSHDVAATLDVKLEQIAEEQESEGDGTQDDARGQGPQNIGDGGILRPEVSEIQGCEPKAHRQQCQQRRCISDDREQFLAPGQVEVILARHEQ